MNDEDITKLAAKLSISLASKEDLQELKTELKVDIRKLEVKLGSKIDKLDQKINTVLKFAEAVDETTADIDRRVKRIERIPVIAHELKNPKY